MYPNALTVCPEHKTEVEKEKHRINRSLRSIQDELTDRLLHGVSAQLLRDDAGYYYLRFSGTHPLTNPHGNKDLIFGDDALPFEMRRRLGDTLTKEELATLGGVVQILNEIEHLVSLLSTGAHFCQLDLLAADIAEVKAVQSANILQHSKVHSGSFLTSDLEVPDLSHLSIGQLTELLVQDDGSIERFREAFGTLLAQINDEPEATSPEARAALVRDCLLKERDRLQMALGNHRRRALRRLLKSTVYGGLNLAMGVYSGSVGSAMDMLQAVGGFYALHEAVQGITDAVRIPPEVKADSWYFLWSMAQDRRPQNHPCRL